MYGVDVVDIVNVCIVQICIESLLLNELEALEQAA